MVKIPIYLHGTYDQDPESLENYLNDYMADRDTKLHIEDIIADIIDATYEVALVFNTETGKLELN